MLWKRRSIREKIYTLPGETRVWPGHHYGLSAHSTVEAEKKTNPDEGTFIVAHPPHISYRLCGLSMWERAPSLHYALALCHDAAQVSQVDSVRL